MMQLRKIAILAAGTAFGASMSLADTIQTHRIPVALAVEAASEAVAAAVAAVRGACNRDAWFARGRSEPIHPL